VWHFYSGAPLLLNTSADDGTGIERMMLGPSLAAGETPQVIVPAGIWQAAQSAGDWSLVGCTVAPGFEFSGFEMAPQGWTPR
jgi:predicted cupin superfamily sugar epimerase